MNAHRLRFARPCCLSVMMGFVFSLAPSVVRADVTFEVLHVFMGSPEGSYPLYAPLVQASDGNFYGITTGGGTTDHCVTGFAACGTIFRMTPDGAVTTLYSFTGGSDGAYPMGALIQGADNNLYGTTQGGGNVGCGGTCGTIFQFNPADGTFTTLHAFEDTEGGVPHAGLIQASDMNFYGTTGSGIGTIFRIAADGTFTTLHVMSLATEGGGLSTPLIQATDGNLYGVANQGGPSRAGTIFRIALDGTFSVIQTFSDLDGGFGPGNALLQGSDGNFYGMTALGGLYGQGTIFRMTVDGTATVLHSFMAPSDTPNQSGLIEGADGNLYGTTNSQAHGGTAFQMARDTTVTTLHLFDGFSNGFNPSALIQATDGHLYGTTSNGGSDSSNGGMVFRLRITPLKPVTRP